MPRKSTQRCRICNLSDRPLDSKGFCFHCLARLVPKSPDTHAWMGVSHNDPRFFYLINDANLQTKVGALLEKQGGKCARCGKPARCFWMIGRTKLIHLSCARCFHKWERTRKVWAPTTWDLVKARLPIPLAYLHGNSYTMTQKEASYA